MKRKSLKRKNITDLSLVILVLVVINFLGGLKFYRLDLTSENRYTLSNISKQTLRNLDDIVFIRIYLDGDLPSDLIRFQNNIRELLHEFRAYGGANIEYEFVNLYEIEDTEARNRAMQELAEKGLRVTDVQLRDEEGGLTTKIIFPGAIINYRGVEFPVNLLKNNPALPYQVNLNNSIQSLEYELVKSIRSLTASDLRKIAFIEGHQELDFLQTYDIASELSLFFQVDRGAINGNLGQLTEYEALIIAQPLQPFNEQDKFVLDQYIMRGGNVLFFIDPVQTNRDSLITGRTYTSFLDLNIYDLLFKYGFRIDYNLVKDLQSSYIRVQTSVNNQSARTRILPWWYHPLFTAPQDHFLTRGLNYIKGEFVTAIDTTAGEEADFKRTVLLATSDSAAKIENPVYISMAEVTMSPDPRVFNDSNLPVAILAEGIFDSYYANYGKPAGVYPPNLEIMTESEPAKIFLAGDGDLIRNDVQITARDTIPAELGYDKDTRQTFGNKEFIMNVINYMTDDQGLIELRSREFKLRLLDRTKIRTNEAKLRWKLINTLVPVVLVLLFGWLFNYVRRKQFGKH